VTMGLSRRHLRALVTVVPALTLVLAGCGTADPSTDRPETSAAAGSALGQDVELYVNPANHARQGAQQLRAAGKVEQARQVQRRIADRPTATWLTPDPDAVYSEARRISRAAAARGSLPVLVAYNVPNRDCGQFSSGGAADIDAYLEWVGSLAAGVGRNPAVVVLEPDALAHALEGCGAEQSADERQRLLTEAVGILKRQPELRVYVDAGNASWITDVDALADALKASGVQQADGFALNVSNFQTTERSVSYGTQLSERLDGARFVVDTSRNGNGPLKVTGDPASHADWCNPPGRRLGTAPTTDTDYPLVDALLWVKQPGDSDGACGDGAPAAGQWWPELALDLLG
jgi:endoglucanase